MVDVALQGNPNVTLNGYRDDNGGENFIELIGAEVADGGTGTATFAFTGATGQYDISVVYIDEPDGDGQIALSVGGTQVGLVALDQGGDELTGTFGQNVSIANGDIITLTGTRDNEEFARVVSLAFDPGVQANTVSFNGDLFNVDEGDGTAAIGLTRTGSTIGEASVTVTPSASAVNPATPGADFTATPITVTFAEGQTTATVEVPIVDDALDEGDEGILLEITANDASTTVGAVAQAGVIIADNDDPVVDGGDDGNGDDGNGDDGNGDDGNGDDSGNGDDGDGVVSPGDDDVISGTDASETIEGTGDDDIITAQGGDDLVKGLGGDDIIDGGDGRDLIFGGTGDDTLDGGQARDFVNGDAGNDTIRGGSARDFLNGGAGNDLIVGGAGRDVLEGNKGDDIMRGGQGADFIRGNKGDDVMRGGDGRDNLRGGAGADVYVLESARGFDTFEGFQLGTDTIRLAGGLSFEDLNIRVKGSDTVIRVADTNERLAVVVGADVTDASNFTNGSSAV